MRKRRDNLLGRKFGYLTVVERAGSKGGGILWKCKCDCGRFTDVIGSNLRGNTSSCGCLALQVRTTHGLSKHPLYFTWINMCRRVGNADYSESYLDKMVYKPWQESIEEFIKYVDENLGPKPTPEHSLDRIDNSGHYVPGNIRWASKLQQSNNRSNVRLFTYRGETQTIRHFADKYGMNFNSLRTRLFKGWTIAQALETSFRRCPPDVRRRKKGSNPSGKDRVARGNMVE